MNSFSLGWARQIAEACMSKMEVSRPHHSVRLVGACLLAIFTALQPLGNFAPVALAAPASISFVSDGSWAVYKADPASGPATLLGQAELVCLNAAAPKPCPTGATVYGFPFGGWTADRSSIPGAKWIWAPGVTGATSPADLQQFFFSKTFSLPPGPHTGSSIRISADDFAEVRVNGKAVGSVGSINDPGLSLQSQGALTAVDLAPFLIAGTNTLTVRGQNGPASFAGGCGPCSYAQNPAALVFGGTLVNSGPSCGLTGTGTNGSGHTFIDLTVQDPTSGLRSVQVTQSTNASVVVPTFGVGTTTAQVVVATKIDQSKTSQVALQVTNVAGQVTNCDPILTEVGRDGPYGVPRAATFHHVAQGESHVTISNGTPGLARLRLVVNGHAYEVTALTDGETRLLDVSSAMRRGDNTLTLIAQGKTDGTATILIAGG
jgi:hypothetical protein